MAVAELGYKIESDQVKVAEDRLDNMHKASVKADGSSEKLANTQGKLAKAIGSTVGRMIALAAAAISIGRAVNTLANFEDGMARLGAITRATDADLAKLRDTAKDLGATTEFSATQAADGLTFLGQAGFTAAESMAAIPAVLDLATASGLGLAQAADTASNIMSGFGIAAGDAAQVADVLAAASSRANTNVAQLGSAMSTVAPIAAAMGIDLNTTAAAIGVMSDAGIQGERAGTALRGVLASLAGPTKQASDALSKYGLTAADVDPEVNGLANVFETLRERGLSTADAMQIFGREAASGALVLIESASRVGDFADELSEAEGEAARMAETMRGALGGSLKTLQSSVEALILAMGEAGLTAAIQAVVGSLTAIIRVMTQAVEFTVEYRGQVIAAATAMTVYFIPSLVTALGIIRSSIVATYAWVAGLVTLRGALIATGIGAFIVLAGTLINTLLKLRERTGSWSEAFTLLGEVAWGVFQGIITAAKAIPPGVGAVWQKMKADFLNAVGDMIAGWNDFITGMIPGLDLLGRVPIFGAGFQSLGTAAKMAAGNADAFAQSADRATVQSMLLSNEASILADKGFGKVNDSLSKLNDTTKENEVDTNRMMQALLEHKKVVEDFENLPVTPTLPGGGGVGGAGGAEESNRIQQLIESLQTEQEIIAQWYAQAQLDLMLASDAELELIGGRNEAKLRLETEYQDRLANIRGVGENQALANTSSMIGSMAAIAQAGGKKTFKIWKAFSIAQATIDSYRAFTQVLADPAFIGRPWARGIAAGAVLASGLAQVASIASTNIGGGSRGGSGGGGGAGAGSVPQQAPQAPPQTRAIIQATGGRSRFTIEEINDIISGIQKESKDGVIIEGFTS